MRRTWRTWRTWKHLSPLSPLSSPTPHSLLPTPLCKDCGWQYKFLQPLELNSELVGDRGVDCELSLKKFLLKVYVIIASV